MISRFKFMLSVLAIALALPLLALGAEKNTQKIRIPTKVEVNGRQLQAGDYKIEWDGNGPNVELSILNGHKTVTDVPAKLITKNSAYPEPAVVTHQNSSGTNVLDQIQFKKTDLVLSPTSAGSSNPTSGG